MEPTPFTTEISFLEAQFSDPGEATPVIRNVVLLGSESKDAKGKVRRQYTPECMRNAVSMYEGVRAFVNHPTPEEIRNGSRDIRDLAGQFVRVRFVESEQKIRGDFEGLPNDPAAAKFVAIAKNMPNIAGCSQNALGRTRYSGGVQIMESIERVNSVDLVCRPATNANLFESTDNDNGEPVMEMKDITENALRIERADLCETLVLEGQTSRDTEVLTLTEKNKALELKVDEFEVKESLAHKNTVIMSVLEESKLPAGIVTDVFKSQLLGVGGKTDDEITANAKALIKDRQAVLESVGNGGVINVTEQSHEESGTGDKTMTAQQAAKMLRTR